jgi:hypothetical protein
MNCGFPATIRGDWLLLFPYSVIFLRCHIAAPTSCDYPNHGIRKWLSLSVSSVLFKSVNFASAAIALGVVLCATPSLAQVASPPSTTTNAPWYERFTFGSEQARTSVPRAAPRSDVRVSPQSRWGVSFGVQEEPTGPAMRSQQRERTRTSAGAFYEVSPRVRVGSQVVVPNQAEDEAWRANAPRRRQPGLKVESAFRF